MMNDFLVFCNSFNQFLAYSSLLFVCFMYRLYTDYEFAMKVLTWCLNKEEELDKEREESEERLRKSKQELDDSWNYFVKALKFFKK